MIGSRLGVTIGLLALSLSTATPSYSDECLKIASDPKNVRAAKIFEPSVKKVFEQAGVCADFVHFPVRRIQESMTRGSIDGEFFRVNGYIKSMAEHVAAIPTPAIRGNGLIISLEDSGFKPRSLKDIGQQKIGVIHGYKWHDIVGRNLKKTVKSNKYLFLAKMLKARRIDGILIEDFTLDRLIEAGVLQKDHIHVSPSVIDLSAYIVIGKKHQKLLEKLNKALNKVIASGGFSTSMAK